MQGLFKMAHNGFGLGAVVSACAWENCAKPVLPAVGKCLAQMFNQGTKEKFNKN